jgi:transcriptional regulator with XRE-family HTH domain
MKLKEFRIAKGISQSEFAELLGVTQATVSRYENGTRKLSQDEIIKICLLLEITPDELMDFEEVYNNYSNYLLSLKNDVKN